MKRTEERDLKSTIITLVKVAELLAKKAFVSAMFDESCRFGEKPWLFEKLRKDLLFQWCQQFHKPTGFNLDSRYTVGTADIGAAGKATAEIITQWADQTAAHHGIKILKKEMRLGPIAPGEVTECILGLLSRSVLSDARSTEIPGRPSLFYCWNTLDSLRTFFKAKQTLTKNTGCPAFEKALINALLSPEYVVNGYPHDILVHDVETLEARQGERLTLVICNGYLSTMLVKDGQLDLKRDRPGYLKIAV